MEENQKPLKIIFIGDKLEVYEELWWKLRRARYNLQITETPEQFSDQDDIDLLLVCSGFYSPWVLNIPAFDSELIIPGSSQAGLLLIEKWFRGEQKNIYTEVPIVLLLGNPKMETARWANFETVPVFQKGWSTDVYNVMQKMLS